MQYTRIYFHYFFVSLLWSNLQVFKNYAKSCQTCCTINSYACFVPPSELWGEKKLIFLRHKRQLKARGHPAVPGLQAAKCWLQLYLDLLSPFLVTDPLSKALIAWPWHSVLTHGRVTICQTEKEGPQAHLGTGKHFWAPDTSGHQVLALAAAAGRGHWAVCTNGHWALTDTWYQRVN